MMISLEDIERAHDVVRAALPPTAAIAWPLLSARLGAEAVVKHENHLPTGAFKVRGGLTYLDALRRREPNVTGIVSATRGNHGQSLAFAGARFGLAVTILAPHGNSREKNAAMRALGANLVEHGPDFQAAREEADRLAAERRLHFVPSFHRDLALGVSTYAFELMSEHRDLDTLYVPIGQGSGICGCIAARDALGLKTEIVGVQAAGAPAHALSFAAGKLISTDTADTFADGMATRVPDQEALDVIAKGAARVTLVRDEEIGSAIRAYWTDTHNLAEGAGAAALAAAMKDRSRLKGRKIGLVLSGGNIDFDLFQRQVAARKRPPRPERRRAPYAPIEIKKGPHEHDQGRVSAVPLLRGDGQVPR
jgi:threonine dehydratase